MVLFTLQWWQLALLFLPVLLNLWGIWHAYRHTFPTQPERLLWMLLSIFIPVLGGLLYLIFGLRRAR